METAPSIFISYAHKDNESPEPGKCWLNRLMEYLEPLRRQNLVDVWSDKKIEMGDDWHDKVQTALREVKAAVLLVSPAFMASEYIRSSELPVLLKQAKERGVVIIPVILRPSLFRETRFKYPDPASGPEEFSLASLQAANSPQQPLNNMTEYEQDQVLLSVAQRLLKIVGSASEPPDDSPAPPLWETSDVALFRQATVKYASQALVNYESSPFSRFFQVPRLRTAGASEVSYESVIEKVSENKHTRELLVVLGDFGSGKSVLLENLTYRLLQRFVESPETRPFPILARLKNYKSGEDIHDFVMRVLTESYGVDVKKSVYLGLQRAGDVIFLFDGFDEMSRRIEHDTWSNNVRSLRKLSEDSPCKIVVTCRTHFFHTSIDEEILHATSKIYLRHWTEEQIKGYLERKTPSNWQQVYSRIENTYNLPELARTPLFLDMIAESFSERFETISTEINAAGLYERYSSRWFSESVVRQGSVLTRWDKEDFITELAWDLYTSHRQEITSDELRRRVKERFSLMSTTDLESFMNDITNCSFLRRNEQEDVFEFAHLSFLEYFVADKLASDLLAGNLDPFKYALRTEIYVFCSEILRNINRPIDYASIEKLNNIVALGNVICIVYRIGDEPSFEFLSGIARSPTSHHPVVRNVVITSLGGYPPEKYAPILLKMFDREENSLNKRSIQIQLKYADCSSCDGDVRAAVAEAVKLPIEMKREDAEAILMNHAGITSAFEHGMRFHRLNLKRDARWVLAVNCAWVLTASGRTDIAPTLREYAAESEVIQVREAALECLELIDKQVEAQAHVRPT